MLMRNTTATRPLLLLLPRHATAARDQCCCCCCRGMPPLRDQCCCCCCCHGMPSLRDQCCCCCCCCCRGMPPPRSTIQSSRRWPPPLPHPPAPNPRPTLTSRVHMEPIVVAALPRRSAEPPPPCPSKDVPINFSFRSLSNFTSYSRFAASAAPFSRCSLSQSARKAAASSSDKTIRL